MANFANNSRAKYDYDIKETFVAGLVLTGAEVKSVRQGNVSLTGSYVSISLSGANLINCHIGPYKYAPSESYDPTQSRALLLNKHEIVKLLGKEKGLILFPLEMFPGSRGLIKIRIGLGRARKKVDKREYLKKKDMEKEIRKNI